VPDGWFKTHCGRMDQGGCGLLVKVEAGRVVRVKGDPQARLSSGYVCPKGLNLPRRLDQPGRLTRPLRRRGSTLTPISWDDALDEISQRLGEIRDKHGARAVSFCQGMPKGLEHMSLIRLANTFGSPNVVGSQNVCHMPRELSGVHTCGFYPVVDYDQPSAAILVFGSNPTSTNEEGLISVQILRQLKAGARLIVVDPQRTPLAERAEVWLRLRPGSECALSLSLISTVIEEGLFDRDFTASFCHGFDELAERAARFSPEATAEATWLEPAQVRRAARIYASTRPAALHWGNGVEHSVHNFDTCRALVCLMALTGNLDAPGGNIDAGQPPVLSLREFVRADLAPTKYKEMVSFPAGLLPRFMVVPPPLWRRAILEGQPYPIRAAYVQTANPVLSYSDSRATVAALEALEFLVVSDVVMTPTAALADLVLPAATQFEFDDVGHYGLGHGFILARPKLAQPPGQCWPDLQIHNQLARRLGLGQEWFDDYHGLLESLLAPSGLSYAQFAEQGELRAEPSFFKYRRQGFRTPSRKVELALSRGREWGFDPLPDFQGLPFADDPEYPLVLNSAKVKTFLGSSDRGVESLRRLRPRPTVRVHPRTAAELGLREGDPVRIETRAGSVVQYVKIFDGIDPRVVVAEPGWWFPEREGDWRGANLNLLTQSQPLSKAFGTPNLRALPCRLGPLGKEEA